MANPHPIKPLSAHDVGGRANYLDLPNVKSKHNNLGSADLLSKVSMGVKWTRIAQDFNIKQPRRVKQWYEEIKEEHEQVR